MKGSSRFQSISQISIVTAVLLLSVIYLQAQGADPRLSPTDKTGAVEATVELSPTDEIMLNVGTDETSNFTSPNDIANNAALRESKGEIKIAPKLLGSARDGTLSVLVHFDPVADRANVAGADGPVRASVRNFVNQQGAKIHYEYEILPNVVNIRDISPRAVAALKRLPGVVKVEEDSIAHTYHNDSMPLIRAYQSQLQGAGFTGVTGAGIRVCVIDTGIDSNSIMYSTRIDATAGWDFVNGDSNPEDDNGHGSHCSGTVLGGTNVSADFACATTGPESMQGVAPGATLIGVKVLNSAGSGSFSNVIAGIDRCASTTLPGGQADVISLSLGGGSYSGTCDTDTTAIAVNNAVAAGVVVVVAAGNDGYANAVGAPACASGAITVAAVYDDNYPNCDFPTTTSFNWGICTDNSPTVDQRCCFSNRSSKLDVAAPGCMIYSDDSTVAAGNGLTSMCGTSQATPHVAGLAALLLDANPALTPANVRAHIRNGAIDKGAAGFDTDYGWGRIDAINSLQLAAPTPCTSDANCDDGLFCNGAETCTIATGVCQPGTNPCTGQGCDEVANLCVPLPTVQYEWNMNTNPGWTVQGQWAWGVPTGGGGLYGGPDPTAGATGSNVYGYNLAGDYANSLAETHLTSTAINCTGLSSVSLRFQRWLGVEVNTYDHAYVRVSNNGTTWTTVWSNSAEVADTAWSLQEFNISAVADNQATVYLRWTMGTTDTSWQYCGWNIDDVQILASGGAAGCTVNAECDDGLFCNGAETCVSSVCQAGTAPNCADAVACTTDACDEATDTCTHTANNAACSDALFCNGSETCSVTLGCQAGTAPNCADAVACTTDSCNETTDTCDHIANNAACSDGLFCNGSETCSVTLGCQAGTNPCGAAACDEATDTCASTGQNIWIVFTGTTTVPGVGTVENEDIVSYNTGSGLWSLIFDGSDVGLSALAIDGLARLSNGDILYSTSAAGTVAGLIGGPSTTSIDDSDIVRFTPTTLGATTVGTHTFYFDGSDVGLTTNAEDVDAITLAADGRLVLSTLDAFSVTGLTGDDEDLIIFTSTALGSVTSGSYAMHFDGSDVGLSTTSSEDVDAAGITPTGTILLSTLGSFSVTGVTGADEDVFQFTPATLGTSTTGSFSMFLDLSTIGISTGANVNAVELVP